MNYPDIFFTQEYQELFKKTAFGGEPCHFAYAGIDYRFYKRAIEGTPYFDIVSPYGYSGPVAVESGRNWVEFLSGFHSHCLSQNIIAEFARLHPFIGNDAPFSPYYEREIYYIGLNDSDGAIWHHFDKGCKSAIGKAQREFEKGEYAIEFENRIADEFPPRYWAQMEKNQAAHSYYFASEFFKKAEKLLAGHIVTFSASESSALFLV